MPTCNRCRFEAPIRSDGTCSVCKELFVDARFQLVEALIFGDTQDFLTEVASGAWNDNLSLFHDILFLYTCPAFPQKSLLLPEHCSDSKRMVERLGQFSHATFSEVAELFWIIYQYDETAASRNRAALEIKLLEAKLAEQLKEELMDKQPDFAAKCASCGVFQRVAIGNKNQRVRCMKCGADFVATKKTR